MGALLAVASALSYGLSDVLGGLLSRRTSFLRVALFGQLGGLVTTTAAATLISSAPGTADLAWGALSGLGTGAAMVFLFRGMSRGAMSVVVPVSAVGGLAVPVVVGTAVLGERPGLLAWAGIAVAVPALWLVSGGSATPPAAPGAVRDGLVAGLGIGVQYLALARAGPDAGIWPVAAGRVASVLAVVVLTALVASPGGPRTVRHRVRGDGAALAAGALAALALVCYLLATRSGLVTVAVVLSSLYPVVPVLAGLAFLEERLTARLAVGLVAAAVAAVAIALPG